jgi:hypothetical protein
VGSIVTGVDEVFRSGHSAGGAKKLKIGHRAPWKFFNGEPFHSKSRRERNRQLIGSSLLRGKAGETALENAGKFSVLVCK